VSTADRYASLDVWRGVACLMVAVGHAAGPGLESVVSHAPGRGETWQWLSSDPVIFLLLKGWLGVPLFFVISGYCIMATLASSKRSRSSASEFAWRRFRRIFPPYWISLVVFLALSLLTQASTGIATWGEEHVSPYTLSTLEWIGNATLTATWIGNFDASSVRLVNPVAWTLCYEEQFYAIALVLFLVARAKILQGALVVTIGVLVVNRGAAFLGLSPLLYGTFVDGRWLQFGLGVALYWLLNRASPVARRLGVVFGLVAVVTGAIVQWQSVRLRQPLQGNPVFELVVAVGFFVLLLLLHASDRALFEHPLARPFRYCGTRCYSLYLVHLPVVTLIAGLLCQLGVTGVPATVLVSVPLAVVAAIAVAAVFHHFVERRFLNLSSETRPPSSRSRLASRARKRWGTWVRTLRSM
jgi:peptidoglycan/LPS O-acetylase OafA/YrhL